MAIGSQPKRAGFRNTIRVPTSVRWPGVIEPGTVVEETISNLDWFPTLLMMAGIPVSRQAKIHGRSFLPLLKGMRIRWNNDLYGEYSQHHYIQAELRATFEWVLANVKGNARQEKTHVIETGDIAPFTSKWFYSGTAAEGGSVSRESYSTVVLRKQGELGWRIVVDNSWGPAVLD